MRLRIKLILIFFLSIFILTILPTKSMAANEIFDHSVNDYFYLKFKSVNATASIHTGFTPPASETNWMIEVTDIGKVAPWTYINVSVSAATGGFDLWQPTAIPDDILVGAWNETGNGTYSFSNTFAGFFPVPFIIPTNQTNVTIRNQWMEPIFNEELKDKVLNTHHYQFYVWENGTQMLETAREFIGDEIVDSTPFEFYGWFYAWNGSWSWIQRDTRNDPIGDQTGNPLLVAVYFADGRLHYLRESWWDNNTLQDDGYGTWQTSYKVVSPMMEYIGAIFEGIFPGSNISMDDIPSFPFALTILTIVMVYTIVYQRKLKKPIYK